MNSERVVRSGDFYCCDTRSTSFTASLWYKAAGLVPPSWGVSSVFWEQQKGQGSGLVANSSFPSVFYDLTHGKSQQQWGKSYHLRLQAIFPKSQTITCRDMMCCHHFKNHNSVLSNDSINTPSRSSLKKKKMHRELSRKTTTQRMTEAWQQSRRVSWYKWLLPPSSVCDAAEIPLPWNNQWLRLSGDPFFPWAIPVSLFSFILGSLEGLSSHKWPRSLIPQPLNSY